MKAEHLAHSTFHWPALVSTLMDLRVIKGGVSFLGDCAVVLGM